MDELQAQANEAIDAIGDALGPYTPVIALVALFSTLESGINIGIFNSEHARKLTAQLMTAIESSERKH